VEQDAGVEWKETLKERGKRMVASRGGNQAEGSRQGEQQAE
jgi:hypothetical protein